MVRRRLICLQYQGAVNDREMHPKGLPLSAVDLALEHSNCGSSGQEEIGPKKRMCWVARP